MTTRRVAGWVALSAGLAVSAAASAQTAPLQSREVPWRADSGPVQARGGEGTQVVYSTTVFVPHAPWLRLKFAKAELAGRIEEGSGAYLRITSLADGAVQYLDAVSIGQWANSSAYFNGDAVQVELLAYPGTAASRIAISAATAGLETVGGPDSLCGADDRTLLNDPRTARHVPEGCTTWLFNDTNRMFLTAGHCGISAGDVQQFNVPLSTATGAIVAPPPEDQYPVDPASIRSNGGLGIGNDAAYFACFPNSNTGLTAFQRQGQFYTLHTGTVPPVAGQTIRITGYGTTSSPVSPTFNQTGKTHSGPRVNPTTGVIATTVSYQTDTTGGNSGSPVHDLGSNLAVGIHTHAGCSATSGNNGTAIHHATLQSYLAGPLGLALSGRGTVTGSLYAIGDGANNFGTCNTTTGNFAKVKDAPPRMEGLAFNPSSGLFFAVNNDTYAPTAGRKLFTVNPTTGAATQVATLSGVSGVVNGLAYDPGTGTLFGVIQATGQLVTINAATGATVAIGSPNGGTIGALEFDAATGTLYGIDDSVAGSRLVRWLNPTQPMQIMGTLIVGATLDCNGLAITQSGEFYTINAANEQLLRINPSTGAATVVGSTGGVFGASYGMSAVRNTGTPACYANCDGSSVPPILNVNDFVCFQTRYAAGDTYANCDGSTIPPTLNVNDFICFQTRFAAGCP